MRASRKKMINVTCSEGVRKRVDDFLASQYQAWKQIQQPRPVPKTDKDHQGLFTCGNSTSNTLIMNYVRFIYSQYNIPDPLEDQQGKGQGSPTFINHGKRGNSLNFNQSRGHHNYNINNNREDIRVQIHQGNKNDRFATPNMRQSKIMDENPIKELSDKYSQTVPKRALFDSRQSTHHRDNSMYQERKTIDSFQKSQAMKIQQSIVQSGRKPIPRHSQPVIEQIISVEIPKSGHQVQGHQYQIYTPKQNKNPQQPHNFFKFSNKINSMNNNTTIKKQTSNIPEVYRYCIACQQAVLQANIERHEVSCPQFAKVYELDLEGILNHLHIKIQNLKKKIRNYSDTLRDQDCQHMRAVCINMDGQSEQVVKNGKMTNRYIANYDQAIKIGRRWSLTTEEINKCRWFIKIREEIKRHFNM